MPNDNGGREHPTCMYRLEENKVVARIFQPDEEIPSDWKDEPPKPRGRKPREDAQGGEENE